DRFRRCSARFLAAVVFNTMAIPFVVARDVSDFKSPLDNSAMTFELQPGEVETAAIKKFENGRQRLSRRSRCDCRPQEAVCVELHYLSWRGWNRQWARRWSARTSYINKC